VNLYAVPVTQPLLELFAERRVYHTWAGTERWKPGDVIAVGDNCKLEPYAQVFEGYHLPAAMGSFSYCRSPADPLARIGRYCSIARGVVWMGPEHPADWVSSSPFFYDYRSAAAKAFHALHDPQRPAPPIWPEADSFVVGHDVWIGEGAAIARGVTIGDGAIVGARALVREDVPPYAIVVGQPARVLRLRFPEALVERFLAARWWRYAPDRLQRLPATEPERFLDALEAEVAAGTIREIGPRPLTGAEILAVNEPP
jgi:acetyltransferase-like isoleucine patch superfamily enzyme